MAGPTQARPPGANARLGLLLGFLAYASWGLLSPLGKLLLGTFEPLTLNAVRFLLATAVLLPVLGLARARESFRLLRHPGVAMANLMANVSLTMFLFSLERLEPTFATLGFYTAPLFTAALASLLLGERMGPWFLPAAAVLLAGGYVTLFGLSAPTGQVSAFGMTLSVLSALIWGLYTVVLRKHVPDIPLRPLMGASFLWGSIYYVTLAVLVEGAPDWGAVSAEGWRWMALYVAVPTLASFILFNAALQRVGAGPLNLLIGAELAFTVLFAYLLLHDTFSAAQLAGLATVLLAVTAYLWSQERQHRHEPAVPPA